MIPKLDRRQPLHFIGAGGIGMSALAGILAERGFTVSGSDPRPGPVLERLRATGVTIFPEQTAATIAALIAAGPPGQPVEPAGEAGNPEGGDAPLVVISSAVPAANAELTEARRRGLTVVHRSDVLAALINAQPSIAVAGSHGKTTTSTLIATLLEAVGEDPTAVIGGIVPAFGSNGRQGQGRWLVAEADESDGSLVKFRPGLGLLTNVELDHTDHYPDLASLVATLQRFAGGCTTLLANRDCPVLAQHFQPASWWSIDRAEGVDFAALPFEERGDGTLAHWYEHGVALGSLAVPLPGRHNLSNTVAAMAACRLAGVPFEPLSRAVAGLRPPGRRFDCRGLWHDRAIVDDYAHHPSEVAATLAMARLMVESGRSPLPLVPRRLVALFQPHRYTRTAQFLNEFAAALQAADAVLLAPLYAAGETPLSGISSEALAEALRALAPELPVAVAASMEALGPLVAERTGPGDLVLAMGAGDVNSLWDRLGALNGGERPSALAA